MHKNTLKNGQNNKKKLSLLRITWHVVWGLSGIFLITNCTTQHSTVRGLQSGLLISRSIPTEQFQVLLSQIPKNSLINNNKDLQVPLTPQKLLKEGQLLLDQERYKEAAEIFQTLYSQPQKTQTEEIETCVGLLEAHRHLYDLWEQETLLSECLNQLESDESGIYSQHTLKHYRIIASSYLESIRLLKDPEYGKSKERAISFETLDEKEFFLQIHPCGHSGSFVPQIQTLVQGDDSDDNYYNVIELSCSDGNKKIVLWFKITLFYNRLIR